ncbi:SDR family oxidoreductase [Paenarthrobacter nicotinovorans]|uniref:SDR family oxidoreductase n=1 Tax=Paenarthrobacter nicotinovorans TaxID=29320 RepID=UPI0037FB010B
MSTPGSRIRWVLLQRNLHSTAIHRDDPLAPQTAIVTGSDSGIGRATAVALAQAGMDVGITWYSDQQGAEKTAEEVRSLGRKAVVQQLDTTDAPGTAAAVDKLAEELGGVDVFVNNSGTGDGTKFLDLDYETWMSTLNTNLNGAFVAMQTAAKRMVKAGRGGRIIAVTSVHEFQPRVGASAYDASKHGLGGLIKTMALELAEHGITANSVAPGEIATPMTGQEDEDPTTKDRPGVPLGRPGDAREIAAVIAFLASPASSYVNGASWPVDGGMLQMGPQAGSHITSHDWRES